MLVGGSLMSNIVEINSFNVGSTGRIMLQLKSRAEEEGFNVYCCIPSERINIKNKKEGQILIGTILERQFHIKVASFTGLNEQLSIFSTLRLIRKIQKLNPSLIHIHNLHNCYINIPILFSYIKRHNIPLIWTLHDCWAFTGRCPHFLITGCNRWKSSCGHCIYEKNEYPYTHLDTTARALQMKKRWFSGVKQAKIITPSIWLKTLVKESILAEYDVEVINNGIDLSIFKPRQSNFRVRYGIPSSSIILLGVSFDWNYKKGIDVFIKLANDLSSEYVIVLVGANKMSGNELPKNIISIERTNDQIELAEIYSCADIFVNPTREESFSLVNIEALACGTPVITYNSGGAGESIEKGCGLVVRTDDYAALKKGILDFDLSHKEDIGLRCISQAGKYDSKIIYSKYIDIYKDLINTEL